MILAFTGHRPDKLGGYTDCQMHWLIKSAIRNKLQELNPQKCISGMALGVDQWAAEICIELGIPFVAAIPFKGQESMWPNHSQETYSRLLETADSVVVVVSSGAFSADKMQIRNEWMVDQCDILLAVWDGSAGGTCNCVRYAANTGRKVVRINPKELDV